MGCTSSSSATEFTGVAGIEAKGGTAKAHGHGAGQSHADAFERQKVLDVSEVYEVIIGKRKSDGKLYAVKTLREKVAHNKEAQELFRNEVKILKLVRHPNVVEFVEVIEDEKTHMHRLVTGLCPKGSLHDRLAGGTASVSEDVASQLCKQMVQALVVCHSKRVAHRNVRAENFLFETDNHLRLIDFGGSLLVEDDTPVPDVTGAPFYVAPEVITPGFSRTGRTWRASDMWSLGVLAYLMLHGFLPFLGKQEDQIFKKIRSGKYEFSEDIKLSKHARDFVKRLLVVDINKRMTAPQALEHPFIKHVVLASELPIAEDVKRAVQSFTVASELQVLLGKKLAASLSEDEEKELDRVFIQFDLDSDEQLNADETAALLKHVGRKPAEAKPHLAAVDENKDGKLSRGDFRIMYALGRLREEGVSKQLFAKFDASGDGVVTAAELRKALSLDSLDTARRLAQSVDSNGDGRISYAEWLKALQVPKKEKEAKPQKH